MSASKVYQRTPYEKELLAEIQTLRDERDFDKHEFLKQQDYIEQLEADLELAEEVLQDLLTLMEVEL